MDLAFCARYVATLPGIRRDVHGNWIGDIGDSPALIWSSHTDTVHDISGRQTLHVDGSKQVISLSRKSRRFSACLGADDTVGVFLMREMYLAGVAGRYIFHYGEESGCLGSSDIARESPETLAGVLFAIALDRAGTRDVITSQMGDTCCSDLFAASLIAALQLPMAPTRGVYTDTASYMDLVPECTNLSVGYYAQHSEAERVDYAHVGTLLAALIAMDQSLLVCARDPYAPKPVKTWPTMAKGFAHPPRDYNLPVWHRGDTPADTSPFYVDERDYLSYHGEWCDTCEAPILDEDDPDREDGDHCRCPTDNTLLAEDVDGLSEDDIKFLRYMRGLD